MDDNGQFSGSVRVFGDCSENIEKGMLGDTSEVRLSDLGLALGLSWGSMDPCTILGLVTKRT